MTPEPIPTEEAKKSEGVRTEAALKSSGQRSTSIMWERTQSIIAIATCLTALGVCGWEVIRQGPRSEAAMTLLAAFAGSVAHVYLNRTNHQRVGGVGGDDAGTR